MPGPVRRALVVGLGRSGSSACDLLRALDIDVRVYDRNPNAFAPADIRAFVGTPTIPEEALRDVDLVVLSPGVPPRPVRARAAQVVPDAGVTGELGFALSVARGAAPDHRVVAITGTNGKSTITALTGALIAASGRSTFVGGNLGPPLGERVAKHLRGRDELPEVLVIECSSFQLETLPDTVTVDVAMLCNASEDHVERYDDFAHYLDTKARLFANLGPGGLGLVPAERGVPVILPAVRRRLADGARLAFVGDDPRMGEDQDGAPRFEIAGRPPIPRSALSLAGSHNATNALFALAAADHLGAWPERPATVLERFEGLAHRMQLVAERDGVRYYDDSKATNVASVVAGLMGFERPFVLLAGGRLKGDDLEPLREVLAQPQALGVVGFGEGGPAIVGLAPRGLASACENDLPAAVAAARTMTRESGADSAAIVLSPGGSSYDQYANFTERGRHFTTVATG